MLPPPCTFRAGQGQRNARHRRPYPPEPTDGPWPFRFEHTRTAQRRPSWESIRPVRAHPPGTRSVKTRRNAQIQSGTLRVLLAPGPLKSSFSAVALARILTTALDAGSRAGVVRPLEITRLPLGDGGDGTAASLARLLGGAPLQLRATDALGHCTRTHAYALGGLSGARPASPGVGPEGWVPSAAVDLATVCGIGRLSRIGRAPDPLRASTVGLGEAIRALARRVPAGTVLVGLGGSASTDGGIGLLRALGARALDRSGQPIPPGGAGLLRLMRLDLDDVPADLPPRLLALVDVRTPLLGPTGSAALFAPQKGALVAEVRILEEALAHLAEVAERDLGIPSSFRTTPGSGAAGGTGYGLSLLARSTGVLTPGAETVLDLAGFDDRLRTTDVVLTSEGVLDRTTLVGGKLPALVLERATAAGRPCILVCARANPATTRDVEVRGGIVATALTVGERRRAGASDLARAALEGLRKVRFEH